MTIEDERMQVLEMIERGEITPSQGLELLKALEQGEASLPGEGPDAGPVEVFPLSAEQPGEAIPSGEAPAPPLEPLPVEPPVLPLVSDLEEPVEVETGEWADSTGWEESTPPNEASQGAVRGEVMLPASPEGPNFSRWRNVSQIPLWVGVGITTVSGIFMYLVLQSLGMGLLFACTWIPFLVGIAAMAFGWFARKWPWLHLRIQQKPGERPERIAISLPLPLGLISWGLRIFRHRIPHTGNINLDEMVMALKYVSPDTPLSVDVDEGENGEKVHIYIG